MNNNNWKYLRQWLVAGLKFCGLSWKDFVIPCGIFSVLYFHCDVCNLRVPLIPEQVARRVVATGGRGDTLTMLQEAGGHGYAMLIHATIHSLTHSPLIKCTQWPPHQHKGPQTSTCQHSWALHPNIHRDMRAIHSHKQVGQKKREGLEGASVDKPKTTIPPLWPPHLLVCGSVCACSKTEWFQALIIYFTSRFCFWI